MSTLVYSCNREHNIVSIWEMGEGSNSLLCELRGDFDHKLEMAKRICGDCGEPCAVCECLYPPDELHDTDDYLGDGSGRDGKIIDPTCADCIEAKHLPLEVE